MVQKYKKSVKNPCIKEDYVPEMFRYLPASPPRLECVRESAICLDLDSLNRIVGRKRGKVGRKYVVVGRK